MIEAIISAVLLVLLKFGIGIYFFRKAMQKGWDDFQRIYFSMMGFRSLGLLIAFYIAIEILEFPVFEFTITLISSFAILLIVEILYINKYKYLVNLHNKKSQKAK